MLAIRFNYVTADEPLKPHLSKFYNFPGIMICALDRVICGPHHVLNDALEAHMISIASEKFNDEGMTKDMLVKLNETLLKCGLNS